MYVCVCLCMNVCMYAHMYVLCAYYLSVFSSHAHLFILYKN